MLEQISEAAGDLNLAATPMSGDFIYPVEAMIHLPGKKLKSKRSGKAQFERRYPNHRTAPLTAAHLPACFALLDRWRQHADAKHDGQLTEDASRVATASLRTRESDACRMALEHHATLGLVGMVVFVDDRLVGFTLGERLSPVQASILFEKTDPDYAGLPQFIFAEFCRTAWADCPEINVGDDWGIPTLRFTKESYRPTRRLAKYTLTPPAMAAPQPASLSTDALPSRIARLGEPAIPVAAPAAPTLRAGRFTDVRDLVALECNCFGEADAFNRRQVRELVRNPHAICRVIEIEGRVEAWALALIRRHATHRTGRLYSMAVDPAQRGRGFAVRLLGEILAELEAADVRHVYLEVAVDNAPAIALYERFGFHPVRRLPDYYAPDSDALSMRRTLTRPA
jgi:ribosomal protein S18 acetylase RimI-like enzyme